MPQCSVPGCTETGGHKFPSDASLMKKWIIAIRRESATKKGSLWQPGASARVCHLHFDQTDYISINYYGDKPSRKRLKKDAVPHVFTFKPDLRASTERSLRAKKRLLDTRTDEDSILACDNVNHEVECEGDMDVAMAAATSNTSDIKCTTDSSMQTEERHQLYSAKNFSDNHIHFYTGLESYSKFIMVLDTLGQAAYHLHYHGGVVPTLPVEDQFFMTLIKLRTHPANKELSIFFGISERHVSKIFITWINFMSLQWGRINWWPSRNMVKYFAPKDFKKKFPQTRVIVDGTEMPIKRPKQPLAQQATFSSYKNRTTVKVLVGATPGGLVSFVSGSFGGSTSDRQIMERSQLAAMCDPGDEVMADKGFNVEDLLIPYHVLLNIPTFVRKRNRLSSEAVKKDRKIASRRVHIERIIGLAKTYKILRDPMCHIESSLSSEIIKVVFILCNFRTCIVPSTA